MCWQTPKGRQARGMRTDSGRGHPRLHRASWQEQRRLPGSHLALGCAQARPLQVCRYCHQLGRNFEAKAPLFHYRKVGRCLDGRLNSGGHVGPSNLSDRPEGTGVDEDAGQHSWDCDALLGTRRQSRERRRDGPRPRARSGGVARCMPRVAGVEAGPSAAVRLSLRWASPPVRVRGRRSIACCGVVEQESSAWGQLPFSGYTRA
jgi:hypothetical protein